MIQFKRGTLDANNEIPVPVTQTSYNLDGLDNWLSKATDGATENRTHNEMSEIVAIDNITYVYDDNGNLIDDGITTYEYDYENRVIEVIDKSTGDIVGEYKYGPLGRRVKKIVNNTVIDYIVKEKLLKNIKAVFWIKNTIMVVD